MRKHLLLSLLLVAACDDESDCFDTLSCPNPDTTSTGGTSGSGGTGTGGSAGTGNSNSGGLTSTGGSGANVGGAGGIGGSTGGTTASGGTSGGGGESGAPSTCDDECSGSTPVCDEAAATCVQCLDSTDHCDTPTPACNLETHECVECVETADCETGVCDTEAHRCVECLETDDCDAELLCDTEEQLCVECLENADCTNPLEAFCDAGSCSPCGSNDDCAHLTDTTVCDTGAGECVECTGTDYASCGLNEYDEQLVCESLTRTCSEAVEHGNGLCEPCVADANCALGQLCVLQTFDGQDVGYFCFWERDASEGGAPASCGTARPYVDTLSNATSIDGSVADICGLDVSTCVARAQFRTKGCGITTPDDSLCGIAPPADAVCAEFDTNDLRCTMTCGSDDDCPSGFPCNEAVNTPYCEL